MNPEARRAYSSWRDQRHRCRNENLDCYKYYGGKGVEVRYSAREFVGWWLEEVKTFTGTKPTISRIDHDGHYEFGNIKLEGHIDNCVWDTIRRHGPPSLKSRRRVVIVDYATMEPLMIADSETQASQLTGVAHSNINAIMCRRGRTRSGKGFTFAYADSGVK